MTTPVQCDLCSASTDTADFEVAGMPEGSDRRLTLCTSCRLQIDDPDTIQPNYWRFLGDTMWSPRAPVQVVSWRMLKRLDAEPWAQDLLDLLYLDDEVRGWAEAGSALAEDSIVVHKDCNGNVLSAGDTVIITKDLDVKGTSFVAKRGTAVRNISLTDNPEHIEGRVNGTRIVILTSFVKLS
ncbi:alkylphosphonate utilization protein [Allohahella marinimesophila]|uniref:Alkylphosphonate utilization protein n=1 Tax=Allohahella marinimesophila TaxID=1054972 RepID=A0ABP7PLW5_9GAMM